MTIRNFLLFGLCILLTTCTAESRQTAMPLLSPTSAVTAIPVSVTSVLTTPTSARIAVPTLAFSPTRPTAQAIASCPVTFPNGSNMPFTNALSPASHGNGKLWTDFGIGGKTYPAPGQFNPDGSLIWKMGWDRGVRGKLTVTGRRLDAPAPPAKGYYDIEGYGDIGFQAGFTYFPSEGCWEITGRVGEASLTFVMLVVKLPFEPMWGSAGMPEELVAKDLDLEDFPNSIGVVYGIATRSGLQYTWEKRELVIKTTKGTRQISSSAPASAQQKVTVNGQVGICVQGAFDAQQKWQNEADVTTLEWSDGTLSYRITQTGLGLTCDDLVRVATPS